MIGPAKVFLDVFAGFGYDCAGPPRRIDKVMGEISVKGKTYEKN